VIFIALVHSFKRITKTATDDNPFPVVTIDLWYNEVDIFIFTNDAYVGDVTDQDLDISAGDVFTIDSPVNLKELIFKNKTAGFNTKIVLVGVPMTEVQIKKEGIY